ncbi:MAG: aminopeptidase P family protein [Gemmatimonadota bacterium]
MPDARERRLAAACDLLTREQLDGLLINSAANIRYLSGFSGSSGLMFVSRKERVLITDYRYTAQAKAEVGSVARVLIEEQSLWAGLWQQLAAMPGVRIAGFESAYLVHRDFQRLLESGSRWQWRPTTGLIESLRERKDDVELAHLREAVSCAEAALAVAITRIRAGLSELEIAGVLEGALRQMGSEEFAFPSIVASGLNAAKPHARPTERVLRTGELLLLDFGARVGGYCSDITRTFVAGRADARQQEVHEVVRLANERASAAVRPGMSGRDADRLARGYIEDRGFGDWFGHSLGHGIGLEVHEAPRLARTAETALAEGAVVTVEPGIYLPEWGGVRIEDDVHLGANGAEVLTRFPRELIAVG